MRFAKLSRHKKILFTISILSILLIGIGFSLATNNKEFSNNGVEVRNGIQYIQVNAGLGYSPNRIEAKASIPSKLIVKTNNTYDCTAFLNIPKLDIKKFLPPTGTTEIEIQSTSSGEEIEGFCGSDTYKFVIRFT